MTNPKNFLISGYYGFDNFGDEAILGSIIKDIKSKFKDANITVLSKNPTSSRNQHNVNALDSFNLTDILKGVKQSDVLISGGGSLLQDATSFKSLLYYLFIILLMKMSKKKVFIFAQGVGPFGNILSSLIVPKILKKVDFITVRDEKSSETLKKWGIESTITSDPIWTKELEAKPSQTVGIQLRRWSGIDGAFLNNLADHINKHFKDYDIKFLSFQDEKDLRLLQRFRNILLKNTPGKKIEIVEYQGIEDTLKEIESLDFLIATRYHACLLGVIANIPTVSIDYDIKIQNLSLEAGLPLIDIHEQDFDEAFENVVNFRDSLKENMKLVSRRNKDLARQNIELLVRMVNEDL